MRSFFQKKRIITLLFCFLIFLTIVGIGKKHNSSPLDKISNVTEKQNPIEKLIEQPRNADGKIQYSANPYNILQEDFSSGTENWDVTDPDGILSQTGQIQIEGEQDHPVNEEADLVYLEYNQDIDEFISGNLTFNYQIDKSSASDVYINVNIYDGELQTISTYNTDTSDSFQKAEIILDSYNTENPNFYIAFDCSVYGKDDALYIDDVNITIHEFKWEEANDPIDPDSDQTIQAYINPNFSGLNTSNVTLFYAINDPTLNNPQEVQMVLNSHFQYTISSSNYASNDVVYYQIWINNESKTVYHHTPIVNFTCFDKFEPNISNIETNATTYYRDAEITCNIEEELEGSGLKNVTMYININKTATSDSGMLILSNNSESMPTREGDFKFIIDKSYLSARYGKELHYNIYAEDNYGNINSTGDRILEVTDNIPPQIKLYKVYAPSHGIENNKSLTVSYNVSEPSNASGFLFGFADLYVKIGSTPENGTDYDYHIISDNFLWEDGGIVNITIGEGNYTYGDELYFFANITDQSGNMNSTFFKPFPDNQRVFVNDTFSPWVKNVTENGFVANYNQNKTLTFEITEPEGAAGINNDSLILEYWVNQTGDHQVLNESLPIFGGEINFTIDQNEYGYKDTVYYRLNVSDMANNSFSSKVGYFNVTDLNAPNAVFLELSNSSLIDYSANFNITFTVEEDSEGSLFKSIQLFVKNGSSASWLDAREVLKSNSTEVLNKGGSFHLFFEINSSLTNARQDLYWNITLIDNEENHYSLVNSIKIYDFDPPDIIFHDYNGTYGAFEYEYDEDMNITYSLWEPLDASGLHTEKTEFKLYYRVNGGTIHHVNPIENIIPAYSGLLSFIIPESAFNYSDTIDIWLNGSDLQGNINSTALSAKTFTIIDLTSPIITLNAIENNASVSYHEDKTIGFIPEEPYDASGLKNATVYLKKGSIPTYGDYDELIMMDLTGFGKSLEESQISRVLLDFQYGDEIFFFINLFDMVGNNISSSINRFNITDNKAPTCIEDADNDRPWTWRVNRELNFTVFDVDFPNSSGIEEITLYYKGGSAPTTSDYHNKTTVLASKIILDLNSYKIEVYLNQTIYDEAADNYVYYFLLVQDVEGNSYSSPVNQFQIHNDVYDYSSVIGPQQGEWLASGTVDFSLDLYFETNAWILINGTAQKTDMYNNTNYISSLTETFEFTKEGTYVVKFQFLDNNSVREFRFSIDLYAPDPVQDFTLKVYGFEIVQLDWREPAGVDKDSVYKIYRSEQKEFKTLDEQLIAEIQAGEQLAYEDKDIQPGKKYYYQIVIVDRVGHKSVPSSIVEANIPQNNLPVIIAVIVIAGVVSVAGLFVYRSVRSKKREKLFSQVDLSAIEDKFEYEKPVEKEQPKWTQIQTKAQQKTEPAPVSHGGFEFTEKKISTTSSRASHTSPQTYWISQLRKLITQAINYELKGESANSLVVYRMMKRIAEKTNNRLLSQKIEAKIKEIYKNQNL